MERTLIVSILLAAGQEKSSTGKGHKQFEGHTKLTSAAAKLLQVLCEAFVMPYKYGL